MEVVHARLVKMPESPNKIPTESSVLLRPQLVHRLAGVSVKEMTLLANLSNWICTLESLAKASGKTDPVHCSATLAPFDWC